jgi:large subunit ribosomal protein L18e
MAKKLETKKLIASMEKAARTTKKLIWTDLAERLAKPTRGKVEVNIDSINKLALTHKGKVFVVPGKLLSRGELSEKVTVVAVSASESAKAKISAAKGEFIALKDLALKAEKLKASELILVG